MSRLMQTRHFKKIADIISDWHDDEREELARHFAERLADTNEKWDPRRFLALCLDEADETLVRKVHQQTNAKTKQPEFVVLEGPSDGKLRPVSYHQSKAEAELAAAGLD